MSGPKISFYSLTGRAKTIVLGQMRCEQQSLACAARTQAILKGLSSFSGNFDQQLHNVQLLIKRTGNGQEQIEVLNNLQETVKRDTEAIKNELSANMPALSPKYWITEEAYAEKQAELKKLQELQKRAENLKSALEEAFMDDKGNNSQVCARVTQNLSNSNSHRADRSDLGLLRRNNEQNIKQIQRSIVEDLNSVYSFDFEEDPYVPAPSFADQKAALIKRISELLNDNSLPQEIIKDTKQAMLKLQMITEQQHLKTFDSITVTRLLNKVASYRQKAKVEEAALAELILRYRALCTMAGEEAKDFPRAKEVEAMLTAEVERLERNLVHQQEQAYISTCVDEVMEEMGYDLIGTREVTKRSGKRFRNELFTFNEGTAVNITYSPEGQISMELGGLAREDRIPTSEEAEILSRDMESFCGEFAEFERRLRTRGIVVGNRIALSPPSPEYASIINANDYIIGESTQISEINAKEKRRKAVEKKVLRRND